MALWRVERLADGTLVYVASPETTDADLLLWCIDDAGAVVDDQRVLYFARWRGVA